MYDRVLIPTDGSDRTRTAVAHGVELAGRYGATVHALYVVDTRALSFDEEGFGDDADILARLEQRGARATETVRQQAETREVDVVTAVVQGTPGRRIRGYADDNDMDLIAMGTRGTSGLARYMLGSTAETVLRSVTRPVLTAKQPATPTDVSYDDILLPTDGSKHARRVADHAFDIAAKYDATVHGLSVLDSDVIRSRDILSALEQESEEALTSVRRRGEESDVDVRTSVWRGTPHDCITSYADERGTDLVVMGAHERRGLDRFLTQNVAERVVRTAGCPVCTIRQ